MKREQNLEQLVITALGNSASNLNELLLLIAKHECTIDTSRYTVMGSNIAISLLVKGPWNVIAKVESGLTGLINDSLKIIFNRTKPFATEENLFPYIVDIVGFNTAATMYEIIGFFMRNNIFIDDFQSTSYQSSLSQNQMFALTMRIGFSSTFSIADLREQFVILCDELNVDGMLAPEKP